MFSSRHFAAGMVLFHVPIAADRTYLILKSAQGHWEFPKGHAEAGEDWLQTAQREVHEETGLTNIVMIPGFYRQIRYLYRDRHQGLIDKIDYFALGQTESTTVVLSQEHTRFRFLPLQEALRLLTHAGPRAILREADIFMANDVSFRQK